MENFPYFRNLAGSLYIWACNPPPENEKRTAVDLCEHQMFFGNVSFVIPCHNEEMNVAPLVKNLIDFYGRYVLEILIVDDNSTDRTVEVTEDLAKEYKCVHLIKRSPPNGVGRALRDGLKEAKGEYITIMDSDFQHIIPEIRDLFDVIADGADVAVGSRFSRESVLVNYAFTKILANRAFHVVANILLGRRFRDISNNLKIFRHDVAKMLVIESNDFAANVETGLKPILLGYRVVEVPISWVNRSIDMGFSTFQIFKTGPNYWKILLRLVWRRITKQPCQKKH
jgi:glycosyltransferase involved in cell wall biosynthesis